LISLFFLRCLSRQTSRLFLQEFSTSHIETSAPLFTSRHS
jgi:hypothetical protein